MKLDYKPQDVELGSFQKRHLVRIILGCVAILCLSLSFIKTPGSPSNANKTATEVASIDQSDADVAEGLMNIGAGGDTAKAQTHKKPIIIASTSKAILAKAEKETSKETVKDTAKAKEEKEAKAEQKSESPEQAAQTDESKTDESKIKDPKANEKSAAAEAEAAKSAEAAKKAEADKQANLSWETIKVQKGDTLAKIFKKQGYSQKDLTAIMGADPKSKKELIALKSGQDLRLQANAQKEVQGISLDVGKDQILYITKLEDKFKTEYKQQPIEKQIAFGKGKVNSSLSLAGKRAGLDQNIISQMVEIFGWNIDFSSDLQPNDTFRVLFEEKRVEGEKIGSGHILAAEIVTKGKKHQAVRYTDKSGHTGYFSPEGQGLRQAFLRYPIEFTRISSGFGSRRHPILHGMRKHTGVDLAAPRGTPVKAAGDGKVIFVGTRGGYGKVVEIQHGPQYSTLYGHLSKFAAKLKAGANVKQGDIIGNVGRTGLATGDHLHYEFRVCGIHRDPVTISLPRRNPIPDANKRQFIAHAKEMFRLMDVHENKVNVVQNEYRETNSGIPEEE